jgi:hypothetical protein
MPRVVVGVRKELVFYYLDDARIAEMHDECGAVLTDRCPFLSKR